MDLSFAANMYHSVASWSQNFTGLDGTNIPRLAYTSVETGSPFTLYLIPGILIWFFGLIGKSYMVLKYFAINNVVIPATVSTCIQLTPQGSLATYFFHNIFQNLGLGNMLDPSVITRSAYPAPVMVGLMNQSSYVMAYPMFGAQPHATYLPITQDLFNPLQYYMHLNTLIFSLPLAFGLTFIFLTCLLLRNIIFDTPFSFISNKKYGTGSRFLLGNVSVVMVMLVITDLFNVPLPVLLDLHILPIALLVLFFTNDEIIYGIWCSSLFECLFFTMMPYQLLYVVPNMIIQMAMVYVARYIIDSYYKEIKQDDKNVLLGKTNKFKYCSENYSTIFGVPIGLFWALIFSVLSGMVVLLSMVLLSIITTGVPIGVAWELSSIIPFLTTSFVIVLILLIIMIILSAIASYWLFRALVDSGYPMLYHLGNLKKK